MSSLIFVRDSDRRALMPVSPAYARKLLQGYRAKLVPHPAFSVIQLDHAVEEPSLCPVMLGIALQPYAAELYLIVQGKRTSLAILYCIVDLIWVETGYDMAYSYAVAISQVVSALTELIPISSFSLHLWHRDLDKTARITHDLVWQAIYAQRDIRTEDILQTPVSNLLLALHTLIDLPQRALSHVVARPLEAQNAPPFPSQKALHQYLTENANRISVPGERTVVLRAEEWRGSPSTVLIGTLKRAMSRLKSRTAPAQAQYAGECRSFPSLMCNMLIGRSWQHLYRSI